MIKPWIIDVIILVALIILLYSPLPQVIAQRLIPLVILISAIWVYIDARRLNIRQYKKTALSLSTTPAGTAFLVFILWIIAFPLYLSYRYRIVTGKIPLNEIARQ